ncbi:XRE family transcriptional regulator [Parapedobacter tibetensis]|uniref:XRE family transcriptional regulator n=1 Tax=Parapedobacter tibetensis TaxID=2972951 RepID=UPI00214D42AF|nr:helix-turn-helix domain-containing protein [Parapedobacter tibetensis]
MANIFFAGNIKFLRTRRKLTQEAFASKLSMTRSKLNCIEMGQTRSPAIEDLLKFSDYFKVSIDSLIKVDLSKLGELKLRELEAGTDVYIKGGNLRVLAITVDRDNNENVEYVPIKAKAGYLAGYNDPEFIASLPRYSLPNLPKQGTYRIFPSAGDSMVPVPEDSDITVEYIEDWAAIKPETPCIVVMKGQDFVFKLVTLKDNGTCLLRSLNPLTEPYTIHADDVLEIWKFYSFTSRDIPEPETDMRQLVRMVKDLQDEVKALSK